MAREEEMAARKKEEELQAEADYQQELLASAEQPDGQIGPPPAVSRRLTNVRAGAVAMGPIFRHVQS